MINEGKFTIEIGKGVTEQKVMEYLLNLKHSGYETRTYLCLWAFMNRMHIDDFHYYCDLLE